jgi:integrase
MPAIVDAVAVARSGKRRRESAEDEKPGFLRRSSVKKVTRERYLDCFNKVKMFASQSKRRCVTSDDWDVTVEAYIETVYRQGGTPTIARYAIYGCAFCLDYPPRAATTFPKSKQALKGFVKRAPEKSRDPVPYEAVVIVADALVSVGDYYHCLCAALLLVIFDGYLRLGEALAIRKSDVTPPKRGSQATSWCVCVAPSSGLVPAKNAEFDAGVIVGAFDRAGVSRILAAVYSHTQDNDCLFALISASVFRKTLADFISACCLKKVGFTPHCLRHGGPSHDVYYHGSTLSAVQQRGRWLAAASVRRYAKPAMLLRRLSLLTDAQVLHAVSIRNDLFARVLKGLKVFKRSN